VFPQLKKGVKRVKRSDENGGEGVYGKKIRGTRETGAKR